MISNEKILIKEYKGLKYMQFKELLDLGITHAYTLKSDGYDFSFGREENKKSYDVLSEALGINKETIIEPVQTHTRKVLCIDEIPSNLNNIDGLITNKKNLALTTKNADCILFFMYDPIKKVIANVHSGWKGTFQKISEITIIKMMSNYGCKAEDIKIFISPAIRGCHFEVDEDVKDLCVENFAFTNRLDEFIKKSNIVDGKQKYLIDTVLINKILFEDLGIKSENIIDSEICSFCENDEVYSARAQGEGFRRGTAIITL